MSPLTDWENFYVIVGTSAGALTGLTFVAVSLTAEVRLSHADRGIAAYNTPTVAQFGAVLLVSAVVSAPWAALVPPAMLIGLVGLAGVIYSAIIIRRQRQMDDYTPVLEDWLWYAACPLVAYAVLLVAAILLPGSPDAAMFLTGGVAVLLMFLGIRNAWDIVTFIAIERLPRERDESREKGASEAEE